MAQVDSTSMNAAMKSYFTDEHVRNTVYEGCPLFGMLSKLESWTGPNYVQPIQIGISNASRSADVTVSLARKDTNKYRAFTVTSSDDYNAISISRKVLKQTGNNRGAFFEAKAREVEGMLQTLGNSCSHALYRGGGGARGQVSSTTAPSTTTFTLNEIEDVVFWEIGDWVAASAANGDTSTDTLLNGGALNQVTGVNRDTGVITGAQNWTTAIPAITTSSFLFKEGDFQSKIRGLGAWAPRTAPTGGDSFFGVDRSVDPTRLAGQRVDGSAMTIREAGRAAATRLAREGGKANAWFMSWQKYNDLITEFENNVQFTETGTDGDIGFTGFKIVGFKTPITVYADHNCPDNVSFMCNMPDLKLISYGPVPDMVDEDGVTMLRESTNSGFEIRAEYMAQLVSADTRNIVNILME
jgi:hypothetical protein